MVAGRRILIHLADMSPMANGKQAGDRRLRHGVRAATNSVTRPARPAPARPL
jgi:hypothetical protein